MSCNNELSRRKSRVGGAFIGAALAFSTAFVHAQEGDRPELNGFWVATLTDLEDPRWRLEDLLCIGCSMPALDYLHALLTNPENDTRPLEEIQRQVQKYDEEYVVGLVTEAARQAAAGYDQLDDPVNQCVPSGFFRAAGPLPMEIRQYDDRVVIRYEYWHSERTIYLDGRDHPASLTPSRLGHSIGWYDGPTLVVDTVGIEPHIFDSAGDLGGVRTSPRVRGIERYTRSEDGQRLEIETTIVDPLVLRRPLTAKASRLWATDVVFQDIDPCEALSGVR